MSARTKPDRPLRVHFKAPAAARVKVAVVAGVALLMALSAPASAQADEAALRIRFDDGRLRIGGVLRFGGPLRQRLTPDIDAFTLSSHRVHVGTAVCLTWRTRNAAAVQIVGPARHWTVAADGSFQWTTRAPGVHRLRLSATNRFGAETRDIYLTVLPRPRIEPRIHAFAGSASQLLGPGYVTLRWHVTGARFVRIEGIDGLLPAVGQRTVYLHETRTFRLIAGDGGSQVSAATTVFVRPLRPQPQPLPRFRGPRRRWRR